MFNKEPKGIADPFRSWFSADIDAVNCWVKTVHIHTLLRKELYKCLQMKTNLKHKELIPPPEIKIHVEHAKHLNEKLCVYGIDPFSNNASRQELLVSQYKALI